ncbi:MAG: bifunctional 4-hydroxy-2-oxoglutarate aldolase/2-dehydro-3-deoxy-phosphogluconate aldolase [Treponema sp.]|nr:bifunctional 4-hydroxy-2-oxoglutarate aldolase/2-dehydro-3-deoxy-phosphogluconate aldolase [Treponema sp.]
MFEDFNAKIEQAAIVPVVKVSVTEDALSVAKALCTGGIGAIEITFRTTEGESGFVKIAQCIKAVRESFPDMLVGAGTVINANLAAKAIDAGAQFIVSPGFNPNTVDFCLQKGVPMYPGVCNPSQIEAALEKNLNLLKFFPAEECGGLKMIKALSGPFPTVKFMATGGINEQNAGSYLACPSIAAVGGSWMVKAEFVKAKDWGGITRLSRRAMQAARGESLDDGSRVEYRKWVQSGLTDTSVSEEEKMKEGRLYDSADPSLVRKRRIAHDLCTDYNQSHEGDSVRREILEKLFPECGKNLYLQGPIQFDYGYNTFFGDNCYANFNFIVLDVCPVKIGNNCFFGPNCSLVPPLHPLVARERRNFEYGKPITIGNGCWISSGVTVCGGVTIGDGCVIGAGSVVTHDIPAGSFAAGNPCRVIRPLSEDDALGIPDDM